MTVMSVTAVKAAVGACAGHARESCRKASAAPMPLEAPVMMTRCWVARSICGRGKFRAAGRDQFPARRLRRLDQAILVIEPRTRHGLLGARERGEAKERKAAPRAS